MHVHAGAVTILTDGNAHLAPIVADVAVQVALHGFGPSSVPAGIRIECDVVRNIVQFSAARLIAGPHGHAGGISLLHELVQFRQLSFHVHSSRGSLGLVSDFIENSPHANGGMIPMLENHLPGLEAVILPELRRIPNQVDIGDLGPDNQPRLVAQVVNIGGCGIVARSNPIRPHIRNQPDIPRLIFRGKGPPLPLHILMAADPLDLHGLSVQDKTFLGIDGNRPQSQRLHQLIRLAICRPDGSFHLVQVRILHSVPEYGIGDCQRYGNLQSILFPGGGLYRLPGYLPALHVQDFHGNIHIPGLSVRIEKGLHFHLGLGFA